MVTIKDVAADVETVLEAVQRQRAQKQMMVLQMFPSGYMRQTALN